MNQHIETLCIYGDNRKLIIFKPHKTFEQFKEKIRRKFEMMNNDIKLIDVRQKAEITSKKSLKENIQIQIFALENLNLSEDQNHNENLLSTPIQDSTEDPLNISFQELIGKKFRNDKLLDSINAWANPKKFHLVLSEGAKKLKKGIKRTLSCHIKGCQYKILLKSDLEGENFEIDQKLSCKYKKHSKFFNLLHCQLFLDHELNFQRKDVFTEKVLKEINLLKGKTKTMNALTNIVNKKFNTEFSVLQIKYQVNKILLETFGCADEDAYRFVQIATEKTKEEGYFCTKLDQGQKLLHGIYLSKAMLLYSNYFLDLVIVDSTYKRNRFNLPLVNVIGVNNFGHNIILAFGVLSNETTNAYTWFFSKLKEAWQNKKPLNFIIDGSNEMREGNKILLISRFIILGITNNFCTRIVLCGWHLQKNLISKFSKVKKLDAEVYNQIISLPFITSEQKFNETISKVKKSKNITKIQKEYLEMKLNSIHTGSANWNFTL